MPHIGEAQGAWTRPRASAVVLGAATALALYLCWRMVAPFVPAFSWALVLAILAGGLHRRLEQRLRRPNLAAALTTALVAVCIVLPLVALAPAATDAVREGWDSLRAEPFRARLDAAMRAHPWLASAASLVRSNVPTEALAGRVAATLSGAVSGSFWVVVQCLVVFFALFYMLRDRQRALDALCAWLPLDARESSRMLGRIDEVVHASVVGTLLVAAVQGLLGGLMFWWLGLPGALLWGLVMFVLSVLPILGAAIVWIPAAILLAVEGSWEKALVLTVWGSVVVALIDNLLYPLFVGNKLRLHTVLVFIAFVGGLIAFGASGLVLGPVVLAVAAALLEVWRDRTAAGGTAD